MNSLEKHNIKLFFNILLFFVSLSGTAQVDLSLQWAKSFGPDVQKDFRLVTCNSMKVDKSGNIYVAGYFSNTADFDPGPETTNLTSMAFHDMFFAKYTSDGNFVYAKRIGGKGDDQVTFLDIDNNGNIYITGYFCGDVDFDPSDKNINLTSVSYRDLFIAKYDTNGNYVYAVGIGTSNLGTYSAIAVDKNENIYVTGAFKGSVDFDPGEGFANLTSSGGSDIFFAKYDAAGNYIYAKKVGNTVDDKGTAIAVDSGGNVSIMGYFCKTVDFDPDEGIATITSIGFPDVFLAKYDVNGNYVFAKRMGDGMNFGGEALAIDQNGNTYISGSFENTIDFDPGPKVFNLTIELQSDIFLAKYDTNGNFIYAKQMGGIGRDSCRDIAIDLVGNIYLTGYFDNTVDFDPSDKVANLTSLGGTDIFFAKFDPKGNFIYAKKNGGVGNDIGKAIAVDGTGKIYVTGDFFGTVNFDLSLGTYNLKVNFGSPFLACFNER